MSVRQDTAPCAEYVQRMHHRDRGRFERVKREHGEWVLRTWLERKSLAHVERQARTEGRDVSRHYARLVIQDAGIKTPRRLLKRRPMFRCFTVMLDRDTAAAMTELQQRYTSLTASDLVSLCIRHREDDRHPTLEGAERPGHQ
jgi:hypothetical protein